jgi:hypothetical protein
MRLGKNESWAVALVLGLACSASNPSVKPDEASVAGHREEAHRESQTAAKEAAMYKPQAAQPSPFGDPLGKDYLYSVPLYNPTEGHLHEAELHRAHARQHEAAAQFLERFEEAECRQFPPSTRAACPLLGPVIRLEDISGGVRATLADGAPVDAVLAHMRCHYAYARARGFDDKVGCPLYVKGIDIRKGLDPRAIELVAKDEPTVRLIREHAREEAVFVKGARP